ncbi:GNAT family N-acetyltransferase [bacterium]|nr:GNAT family N-acetyltransferase [bacterium]
MSVADYNIKRVDAEQVWPLRHKLLRPHQALEESRYPGDEHRDAGHFAAFAGRKMVGITSVFHEAHPDIDDRSGEQQWRLRGMATAEAVRGTGAGGALLLAGIDHVVTRHGKVLWCNARTPAVGFYERHGFTVIGEEFEIDPIGPHYLMRYSPSQAD